MELKDIKGLGPSRIKTLNEKGIFTPLDLLNAFPNKYLDFTSIDEFSKIIGAEYTLKASLIEPAKAVYFKGLNYTIGTFKCAISGKKFKAVWYGQPYMKNNLVEGFTYFLVGKINKKGQLVVTNQYASSRITDTLVPVYGAGVGLSSNLFSSVVKSVLEDCGTLSVFGDTDDVLPLSSAYSEIHFPTNIENLTEAKKRITLEDLVMLASLENYIKSDKKNKERVYNSVRLEDFENICPFKLTDDQKNVLTEIMADLDDTKPMNRLLVGDVGSGKTMVAFGAVYKVVKSNYQAILICPTEILAKQHYANAKKLFGDSFSVELLVGSLKTKEKREIIERVNGGARGLIIATHATLSDNIKPNNLALVITDEQHRFGVSHRAILSNKGESVDSLVMSATPIPRSLALVLFGGLECSTINSRPHGDSKITTNIVSMEKEKAMWEFIKKEIRDNSGRVFVVAPRIDEGENEDISSVYDVYDKLIEKFDYNEEEIAVVHGKMKKTDVDELISKFTRGEVKVLISTTIIEVGIDVKSANLMVIYNSERFGLATLHQLRGRVGRDGREGYCFCMVNTDNETSIDRLKKFKKCNSGIKLAEEDLKLRGAGTIYGTKQHGASEVFLNIDFSLDEYNKAKKLFVGFSEEKKQIVHDEAVKRFGDIYKKVILN